MGRKIPAKKHRGVKDPLKQQEKRNLVLQSKINAAPTDPDDQPVPKSLTRLFEFKSKVEAKLKSKVKKNQSTVSKERGAVGGGDGERGALARMSRLPGEGGREFQLRVRSALRALTSDSQAELELHHTLYPDDYHSHAGSKKEERLEDIRALKQKRREARARRGGSAAQGAGAGAGAAQGAEAGGRAGRRQRQALRRQQRALHKQQEAAEAATWAPRYERLSFGEVVHAPPAHLPAPPARLARRLQAARDAATATATATATAGTTRGLLLEELLRPPAHAHVHAQGCEGAGAGAGAALHQQQQQQQQQQRQERLERARLEAVAAYRTLKRAADAAPPLRRAR